MKTQQLRASIALVVGLVVSNGMADLITGVTATASTTLGGRVASHVVDYSGLTVPVDSFANSGVTHVYTAPDTTMWLSTSGDPSPSVTFDLGAVYTVQRMRVWNYNEWGFRARGVQGLTVLSSELGSPDTSQGAQTLAEAAGPGVIEGELITFAAPFRARYIEFAIASNYGDTYTGLSEAQFDGVAVDPATLPTLITGVTATASSTFSTRAASNTVNYSGLTVPVDSFANSGVAHDYNFPGTDMWLSTGDGFGGIDPNPSITFDLGAYYTVFQMRVWNYVEWPNRDRGVQGLTLLTSREGIPNESQGAQTLAMAATTPYLGDLITFAVPFRARYIKFAIASNHGDPNSFYGLSEVQFNGLLVPPQGTVVSIR
jgi:hypothetical protein